ncbi:MAG: hypothetical protein JST59_04970 [Actinobacteria bacterium]|nr:hypothetical protein [Actinomycetota bacterium]
MRKAEQFLAVADRLRHESEEGEEVGDALVTVCVHAGIAASDVLCCKALGHYVQGDDHQQAIAELSKVAPGGKELGKDLRALLQMKTQAAYAAAPIGAAERKRAWRKAESLVEAARSR